MGRFLNKGNLDFAEVRRFEYIDKSAMIETINATLCTERRCSCVTRCRRFGKSMAARMLYAYYDKSCDSRALFEDLSIARMPSFEEHLNKYPTIYLDMTRFTTVYRNDKDIVNIIQQAIKKDVCAQYPDIKVEESYNLMDTLFEIADQTKERFMFIIDEWDAICREYENVPEAMDDFVNWLRRMFKTDETTHVFVGVYMTGILPIKKYKTESALNNFREYSMVQPGALVKSFGFTSEEVKALCARHGMDYTEMARWYDGYQIGDESEIFNPYSVMEAISNGECANYFKNTGAFTGVSTYIQMNFDGLKDDIIRMLAGARCDVNVGKFQNDMHALSCKDDVLTVLIHLGYLAYDRQEKECYIPNKEIWEEFTNAVADTSWEQLTKTVQASKKLLKALWSSDEQAVSAAIDQAHDEHTSILSYNNENSLACVLEIAFIAARDYYSMWRELPSGKGFADIVLLPLRNTNKPAVILELKFDGTAQTAISQIRQKQYPARLQAYHGSLLLCGINYDKTSRTHSCRIEKSVKS